MSLILNKFGANIRNLRLKRKYSQEELGRMCGLHRTYVGMIERGEKNITVLTVKKIAKALDVPVCDIFSAI